MKKWNLKVKNNPQEITNRLESIDGLIFNMSSDRENSIKFKLRKRILYAWYLIYDNSIVVNGKLSKADTENETDVEILFNQHLLWKSLIFLHIFLGLAFLIAIVIKSTSVYWYLFGAIILALGVLLWVIVQKKYERNIQEYKTLILRLLNI